MRRRYIIAVVIGGLLGFVGTLCVDILSAYQFGWGYFWDGERGLPRCLLPQDLQQARLLINEALFLHWLGARGELASQVAAMGVLVSVSCILAVDLRRDRRARKAQKATSVEAS